MTNQNDNGMITGMITGMIMGNDNGVRESAGINRLGIGNERVLQGKLSQLLWPRTVRW